MQLFSALSLFLYWRNIIHHGQSRWVGPDQKKMYAHTHTHTQEREGGRNVTNMRETPETVVAVAKDR